MGWRSPRCNGYHRRKWILQHEFKSRTITNTLVKGVTPIILPPLMSKYSGGLGKFALVK